MKAVIIVLSMLNSQPNIVHQAEYTVKAETCAEAERMALEAAMVRWMDSGEADEITLKDCKDEN